LPLDKSALERRFNTVRSDLKKDYLHETEKKVYILLNHYYRLTLLSIEHIGTALSVWIKGILPILLEKHGINFEEWERLCDIGDDDKQLSEELDRDWEDFLNDVVRAGKIDREILSIIDKGKKKSKRMRQ